MRPRSFHPKEEQFDLDAAGYESDNMFTLYVNSYSHAAIHWHDCRCLRQHGGESVNPPAKYYVEGVSLRDALQEARTTGLEIRMRRKRKPGE